jgi:hypothetical protein
MSILHVPDLTFSNEVSYEDSATFEVLTAFSEPEASARDWS